MYAEHFWRCHISENRMDGGMCTVLYYHVMFKVVIFFLMCAVSQLLYSEIDVMLTGSLLTAG